MAGNHYAIVSRGRRMRIICCNDYPHDASKRQESTATGVRRTNSGVVVEMGLHRKKLGLCIGCGSEVRNEGEH